MNTTFKFAIILTAMLASQLLFAQTNPPSPNPPPPGLPIDGGIISLIVLGLSLGFYHRNKQKI